MVKEKLERFRVVISKEANEKLELVVEQILKECDYVKLSKSGLAEYVFLNLDKLLSEAYIKKIINLYFDENKVVRKISQKIEDNQLDVETRKILREYCTQHLINNVNETQHKSA